MKLSKVLYVVFCLLHMSVSRLKDFPKTGKLKLMLKEMANKNDSGMVMLTKHYSINVAWMWSLVGNMSKEDDA